MADFYVATMNDGIFIIDRPPRAAPVDCIGLGNGAKVIAKMAESTPEAQALAELFVSAADAQSEVTRLTQLNFNLQSMRDNVAFEARQARDRAETAERALAEATRSLEELDQFIVRKFESIGGSGIGFEVDRKIVSAAHLRHQGRQGKDTA